MAITPDNARHLLTELARFEVAAFERTRALAPARSLEAAELEARCERALQDTLRDALFQRDRSAAREPLRHVARRLGVELDEGCEDW